VARAVFISSEDSFLQGEEGLLAPTAYASYKASLRAGMGSSGLAAAWILTRDMYEPKYRAFMDEISGDINRSASGRSADTWRTALKSLAPTSSS
jgi:hypothetical protein